jgi:hypothetical protein
MNYCVEFEMLQDTLTTLQLLVGLHLFCLIGQDRNFV